MNPNPNMPARELIKMCAPNTVLNLNDSNKIFLLSVECHEREWCSVMGTIESGKLPEGEYRLFQMHGINSFARVIRDAAGKLSGMEVSTVVPGEGLLVMPAEAVEMALHAGKVTPMPADHLITG